MAYQTETLVETVTIEVKGITKVFEVIEDASRFTGRRAYVKGSTQYYEMPVFEAGLAKADKVTRV